MEAKNNLRINLAIGTLTLWVSVACLYIINLLVIKTYRPDVQAILDKVLPLTIMPVGFFRPEPVERMQFVVSLLVSPVLVFLVFLFTKRVSSIFKALAWLPAVINIMGLIAFAAYLFLLFKQNLFFIAGKTTGYYFSNNACNQLNPALIIVLYSCAAYGFFIYSKTKASISQKAVSSIISWILVSVVILDVVFYSVFHLSTQGWGTEMEGNAVFYSITQVFAGKTLLVDINSQYGLYAWMLYPVFKLIGLSTLKFSWVMGILSGLSFLLIYLGIKKILKQDVLALIVFFCLFFWQYWNTRIPLAETSRAYYQYWPIRMLFPSISFVLVVAYYNCAEKLKTAVLALLSLSAAFAILWNLDTGIVVFGATLAALFFFSLEEASIKQIIKKNLVFVSCMLGAFLFAVGSFLLSVKTQAHSWPDVKRFTEFQNVFYISGYYMLPMARIHFWNLIILVYLVAFIYCVAGLKRGKRTDIPIIAFLSVLGLGIFSYYQGRSYDSTITAVMYPAVIILGVFCGKLLSNMLETQARPIEGVILFLLIFFFLIDGAASMLYYIPSTNSFAIANAFNTNAAKENILQQKMSFIKSSIPTKDTVLILAQDYESYYYAEGQYYNPVNLPGSTEIFFKSQVDTLLQFIRTTKYPIVYDANLPWVNSDTIIKTLAEYSCVEKELPGLGLVLLKPNRLINNQGISINSISLSGPCKGSFIKYLNYPVAKAAKF